MNMGKKEFLRNESVYVRSSAAGNPNTSGAVLAELAKDSDCIVRRSAAGNNISFLFYGLLYRPIYTDADTFFFR